LSFVVQLTGTRATQVGRLLQVIPTRGANAFPELIHTLVISQQEHIAQLLDPALTQHYKQLELEDGGADDHMEVDSAPAAAVTSSRGKEKSVDEKVLEIRKSC